MINYTSKREGISPLPVFFSELFYFRINRTSYGIAWWSNIYYPNFTILSRISASSASFFAIFSFSSATSFSGALARKFGFCNLPFSLSIYVGIFCSSLCRRAISFSLSMSSPIGIKNFALFVTMLSAFSISVCVFIISTSLAEASFMKISSLPS